jgi:hypothetical protein
MNGNGPAANEFVKHALIYGTFIRSMYAVYKCWAYMIAFINAILVQFAPCHTNKRETGRQTVSCASYYTYLTAVAIVKMKMQVILILENVSHSRVVHGR